MPYQGMVASSQQVILQTNLHLLIRSRPEHLYRRQIHPYFLHHLPANLPLHENDPSACFLPLKSYPPLHLPAVPTQPSPRLYERSSPTFMALLLRLVHQWKVQQVQHSIRPGEGWLDGSRSTKNLRYCPSHLRNRWTKQRNDGERRKQRSGRICGAVWNRSKQVGRRHPHPCSLAKERPYGRASTPKLRLPSRLLAQGPRMQTVTPL